MRNLIEEKPTDEINGRALYNACFVADADIINKDILDIGCGFGWMELELLKRGAKGITGLEVSEADLETAKKHIHNEKINLKVGTAVDLPFGNGIFDTVISWEVIEHIPRGTELKMFEEINRVLKSAGVFYMSTPNQSFFSNIFDPAWWLIGHRHYSRNQLIALAKNSGFEAEKIVINGGWWEIFGINNLYIAKWIFRRRPFFQSFISSQQNLEYEKNKGFTGIFIKFKKNG